MIGTLRSVVLDAPDVARLAEFYAGLAGWEQVHTEDDWVTLTTPDGWRIGIQEATEYVPPKSSQTSTGQRNWGTEVIRVALG